MRYIMLLKCPESCRNALKCWNSLLLQECCSFMSHILIAVIYILLLLLMSLYISAGPNQPS